MWRIAIYTQTETYGDRQKKNGTEVWTIEEYKLENGAEVQKRWKWKMEARNGKWKREMEKRTMALVGHRKVQFQLS